MRITNDPSHTWNSRDFLGSALRVATCDHDARIGLSAVDAADGLTKLVVGCGGDGAGVQDDEIGVGYFTGGVKTTGSEAGFERGSIGLRSPASERLYEVA